MPNDSTNLHGRGLHDQRRKRRPMRNSPIFASLDDCEHWIADVMQPDPSVIDMFCIKREVSAWGVVK